MALKRFQNKVAESRIALPVTLLLFCLINYSLYLLGLLIIENIYILMFLGVSIYFIVELNNKNSLLRTYSRMVSCSFVALMSANNYILSSLSSIIIQFAFILSIMCIFAAYHIKKAEGYVFYTFLFLGIATIFKPVFIFFIPILWIIFGKYITPFSLKVLIASLIAILLPYWFYLPYYIYNDGDINLFINKFLFKEIFDYSNIYIQQIVSFSFLLILSIIGTIHFQAKKTFEKAKIRAFYSIIMIILFYSIIILAVFPTYFNSIITIIIVCISILNAHFVTFTNTKLTNYTFILSLITAVLLTTYNLWIPLLNYL